MGRSARRLGRARTGVAEARCRHVAGPPRSPVQYWAIRSCRLPPLQRLEEEKALEGRPVRKPALFELVLGPSCERTGDGD